ncbi:MAG: CYTH domain-containing protein [Gammaproteobacteria bacterium]|nr:CYTH domain-containing protein [Gammaproteobacteria bacterium]
MTLEQEMKLVVTSDGPLQLSELEWLRPYCSAQLVIHHLVSTYFDTPDLHLITQGVGLRLRNENGSWLQTVKATGQVKDGFHQREEWEQELNSANFDLEKLKQTPLNVMIQDSEIWPALAPMFTTDFIRQSLQLSLPQETTIELAYDRGQIRAGELSEPVHEIELELKSGSIEQLKQLARECCQKLPVVYGDDSKAHRGYRLVGLARE